MNQGYLEQESKRVNEAARKRGYRLLIVGVCLIALIYFLMRDSLDLKDPSNQTVVYCMIGLVGLLLLGFVTQLLRARPAANGKNLILPFEEGTKEAVGNLIDREASEGKIQVEEYIDKSATGKKAYDEKIVLMPSYLLLCGNRWEHKITAIPRDKIFWVCAQDGHKGGSFIVRLLIFTEKKIFTVDGVDTGHLHRIAEQLYQYIPNVFREYDPSSFPYELEELYTKNREGFLRFYEEENKKQGF